MPLPLFQTLLYGSSFCLNLHLFRYQVLSSVTANGLHIGKSNINLACFIIQLLMFGNSIFVLFL